MNNSKSITPPTPKLDDSVSFETILSAWQSATDRLQQTHHELRHEVRRLTDELEQKNLELARQNRLADLGQMAAHVAHEIRNGLMPITLYLSQLHRHMHNHSPRIQVDRDLLLVDKIKTAVVDVESTINDLLHFAGDRPIERQPTCLVSLTRSVCQSIQDQFDAHSIELKIDAPDDAVADIDPNMMQRCMLNLLLNAVDAMKQGGTLQICIRQSNQQHSISIADTGPGIEPGTLSKLFEPFYTTKSAGTGLGLPIVEKIVHSHGGTIDVTSTPGNGATFGLTFPRISQSKRADAPRSPMNALNSYAKVA